MTENEHRIRIDNITFAEKNVKKCERYIKIHDYMPGQANYNLGEYPLRVSAAPTDYDRELIPKLKKMGVQILQLHEEWNDPMRFHGADKFSSPDPEGLKQFIQLCHENDIRVLAYVSSGYFAKTDPDYRPEFSSKDFVWKFNCYAYTEGSHSSASWQSFVLPKTLQVMDEYGFDGIYNDWGYDGYDQADPTGECLLKKGFVDPVAEDFLSQIYSEVKKRGGIYKMHCDRNNAPPCRSKVCDYLWIGEFAKNTPGVGKDYIPYVVPCQDRHFDSSRTLEDYLALTVPFMQFPLLKTGRPILGECGKVSGVTYYGGDEQEFYENVGKYRKENPDGPQVYSLWSSIPDDPDEWNVWEKAMALYRPMTTENTSAYIELRECDTIVSPLPERVYASMFVNESVYLVISNLTEEEYTVELKDTWQDRVTGQSGTRFTVPKGKLLYLIKK